MSRSPMKSEEAHGTVASEALSAEGDPLAQAVEVWLAELEEAQQEGGQLPDRVEFIARYPALAADLTKCLEGLEQVHRAVPQLRAAGSAPIAADPVQPEATLGDFRILHEIGRGGMGIVYAAEQISLPRRVALKVLPFAAVLDPRQIERFQNEARAAATLDHPGIVSVYSVGCARGVHYYAMRLIEGQSLAEVIDELRTVSGSAQSAGAQRGAPPGQSAPELVSAPMVADEAATQDSPPGGLSADGDSSIHAPANDPPATAAGHLDSTLRWAPASTRPSSVMRNSGQQLLDAYRTASTEVYFRKVARLGIKAAESLDFAHQRGILHRDIKPGNLMLDADQRLWITDFGLARIEAEPGMTMTGDILGTLRYMSPEQALAQRAVVDQRADIYALGATLYELFTLQPLFPGTDRARLLQQIAEEEPVPPSRINPAIPTDLETILLKAIRKEPSERYFTAQELADDLHRYLAHELIRAKRPTLAARFSTWTRRHRALCWATMVVLLVTTLASMVSTVLISHTYQREKTQRARAESLQRVAELQTRRAETLVYAADMRLAGQAWRDEDMRQVVELLDKHRPELGQSELGQSELDQPELDQPELDQPDLRGYEWHFLDQAARWNADELATCNSPLYDVNFSPDGRSIVTAGGDGIVRVHDVKLGKLRWSMDAEQGEINGVLYSPNGKQLATAGDDGTVKLWQVNPRQLLQTLPAHDQAYDVNFTPDGKRLVTAGHDGLIRIWDCLTGEPLDTLRGHTRAVERIDIGANGKYLASAGRDGTARLWDLASKRPLQTMEMTTSFVSVVLAPDNRWLATVDKSNTLRSWNLQTGKQFPFLPQAWHRSEPRSVALSADGQRAASGDSGGVIRLWRQLTHRERLGESNTEPESEKISWHDFALHQGRVYGLAFSPNSKQLVSIGEDGRMMRLQLTGPHQHYQKQPQRTWAVDLAPIADHDLIAEAGDTGIHLTRTTDGEVVRSLSTEKDLWHCVAVDREGRKLAAGTHSGAVHVWDVASGDQLHHWKLGEDPVGQLAFAPGTNILGVSIAHEFRIVELEHGEVERSYAANRCQCWAFSPDQKLVAVAIPESNTIELWDRLQDCLWTTLPSPEDWPILRLAFSPDSRHLAAVDKGRNLTVWDLHRQKLLFSNVAHDRLINALQFTPDGNSILTASDDGYLRLWHVASGQRLFDLHRTRGHGICSAKICGGGKALVYIENGGRYGHRTLCFGRGVTPER